MLVDSGELNDGPASCWQVGINVSAVTEAKGAQARAVLVICDKADFNSPLFGNQGRQNSEQKNFVIFCDLLVCRPQFHAKVI